MAGWSAAATAAINAASSAYTVHAQKSMFEKQRQDQMYYATTAHQREVADLRAAGLNPILSANKGAQGGSPVPQPALADVGGSATSGFWSAKQAQANVGLTEEATREKKIKNDKDEVKGKVGADVSSAYDEAKKVVRGVADESQRGSRAYVYSSPEEKALAIDKQAYKGPGLIEQLGSSARRLFESKEARIQREIEGDVKSYKRRGIPEAEIVKRLNRDYGGQRWRSR